jgi:hypothetical protein
MNPVRRFLLPIAALTLAALWLFPPFLLKAPGIAPIPAHHHFLLTGLHITATALQTGQRAHLDIDTLLAESCALTLLFAALYCAASYLPFDRATKLPPRPLFVPSRN